MQARYEKENPGEDLKLPVPGSWFKEAHQMAALEGISYNDALNKIRHKHHELIAERTKKRR